ncbi:MAG: lactate utilization protein [Anaerolineales bacterium]|nr:lactate utilization protein [Anaerolineales bacterium]
MTTSIRQFRQSAFIAIEDIRLQTALENATGRFRAARATALADLPDPDAMRDHFKKVRAATIANLAEHLEAFERNATANGSHVHWARDAAEARQIVLDIAKKHGVTMAAKSKSMATEEIHLNAALSEAGIAPVETDLGEWIVQLAEEPPSHIIAPAIHKTKEQVADLFTKEAGREIPADIPTLTAEARRMLREKFLAAGMGISGGNLGVAETGSIVLVTNEGNGRMVTSLPPVHIAVMGIEKIAPTWDEAALWLALLARSATGQPLSIYTSIVTGPATHPPAPSPAGRGGDSPLPDGRGAGGEGDVDGPQEVHIVLLDNGRSKLIGTKYEEILQCIRCGACLNVCPVYREAGGHAYGSPYSGPIGAVISPLLFGLENFAGLPQASSLCGACKDVCPARIDLPRMLVELRGDEVASGLLPWWEAMAERGAAMMMGDATWMRVGLGFGRVGQGILSDDLPRLAKKSFRKMWADGDVK